MRRNVLVVDDDPHIQELVKFFLEQSGFVVRICKDGYSALEELNANPYDVLILDISMPHMNGFKILKSIRATPALADLPVIMLTSSNEKNDVLRAKEQQVTDFVIKPPLREDLLARVERVLGGRPQFEEIRIDEKESVSNGAIILPFKVKSVSQNGLILILDFSVKKGDKIKVSSFELFKTLNLEKSDCLVSDCTPTENGKFEVFVSFLGLKKDERERLREWIAAETHLRRNQGLKVY